MEHLPVGKPIDQIPPFLPVLTAADIYNAETRPDAKLLTVDQLREDFADLMLDTDAQFDPESTNPVANKTVTAAIEDLHKNKVQTLGANPDPRYATGVDGEKVLCVKKADSNVWIAATETGLFRSVTGGFTWTKVWDKACASCFYVGEGVWLAGGYAYGLDDYPDGWGIMRSTDNGLTWERCELVVAGVTGPCPWSFATDGDIIVAGLTQEKGAIWSEDGGQTWNKCTLMLPTDTTGDGEAETAFLGITYSDGLWLAGGGNSGDSLGGIWASSDGKTWSQREGTTLNGAKVYDIRRFTTRTGTRATFACVNYTDSYRKGGVFRLNAAAADEAKRVGVNADDDDHYYSLVEYEGDLYTVSGVGQVKKLAADGYSFEVVATLPNHAEGYALEIKDGRMVIGSYGSGVFTSQYPRAFGSVDDVLEVGAATVGEVAKEVEAVTRYVKDAEPRVQALKEATDRNAEATAADALICAEAAQTVVDAMTAAEAAEESSRAADTSRALAVVAQGHAEGAQADAELAQAKAEGAQKAAEDAQGAAEDAQGAAEDAQKAAEEAQTAAEVANNQAQSAKTAAQTAKTQAQTAKTLAQNAVTQANQSINSMNNLLSLTRTQANKATDAADRAELYRDNANAAVLSAQSQAGEANESAILAAASEKNAKTSETNAKTSETNAAKSAQAAEEASKAAVAAKNTATELVDSINYSFDTWSDASVVDGNFIGPAKKDGVQPRLHNRNKDIHGVTGFSGDAYHNARFLFDWTLARSNDSAYLASYMTWEGNRGLGGTNTFVQPLIPANKGTTAGAIPLAIPCFENSPLYWSGWFMFNDASNPAQSAVKQILLDWSKVNAGGQGTIALTSDVDDVAERVTAVEEELATLTPNESVFDIVAIANNTIVLDPTKRYYDIALAGESAKFVMDLTHIPEGSSVIEFKLKVSVGATATIVYFLDAITFSGEAPLFPLMSDTLLTFVSLDGGATWVASVDWIKYTYTAKDYVQDGLRYHFDGIENVAYGEHSGVATQWTNLITGGKISIGSSRFFSRNSLVQPTAEGVLYIAYNFKRGETFEVLGVNNSEANGTLFYAITTDYVGGGVALYGGVYKKTLARLSSNADTPRVYELTPTDGGYPSNSGASGGGQVRIFGGYNLTSMAGEVFSARIYSRELTAEEKAHNEFIERMRYGL